MKKIALALLVALAPLSTTLLASPYSYSAEDGWYFTAMGSVTFGSDSDFDDGRGTPLGGSEFNGDADYESGFGLAFAGGYHWSGFRLELEYAHKNLDFDHLNGVFSANNVPDMMLNGEQGNIAINSLMANILYDFYPTDDFFFYLGTGVGVAWVNTDVGSKDTTDGTFAWQLLVGMGYNVTERVSFMFGYRLFTTGDVDVAGQGPGYEFTGEMETPWIHSIEAGVRFNF